jgi:hypothetical protein
MAARSVGGCPQPPLAAPPASAHFTLGDLVRAARHALPRVPPPGSPRAASRLAAGSPRLPPRAAVMVEPGPLTLIPPTTLGA